MTGGEREERIDGETRVGLAPEPAFAWLADPRNASAWFASVRLERPPATPLRAGAAWRFLMTRQRDRPMPMRLAEYTPSTRFIWETNNPGWRGNLRWVFAFAAETDEEGGAPATRIGLHIEQRPGVLGWPLLALAWVAERVSRETASSVGARAQRAVERARDALESAPPTSFIPYGYGPARAGRSRRSR